MVEKADSLKASETQLSSENLEPKPTSNDKKKSTTTSRILKLLSNAADASILCLVHNQPSYPMQLADLLGMRLSRVSERLAELEKAGLVRSEWGRVANKNIKIYSSNIEAFEIGFDLQGLRIQARNEQGNREREYLVASESLFRLEIPKAPEIFAGRMHELDLLKETPSGMFVVWGLPGIGKTSLVSKYVESQLRERPVFWHDIREVDSLGHLLSKLAIFLGGLGLNELLNLLRSGVDDDRLKIDVAVRELDRAWGIVVFDDYHYCNGPKIIRLIQELGTKATRIKAIVISRNKPDEALSVYGAKVIKLGGLNTQDVEQIFYRQKPRPRNSIADSTKTSLGRNLDVHPLAIRMLLQSTVPNGDLLKVGKLEAEKYLSSQLLSSLTLEEQDLIRKLSVFREAVPVEALDAIGLSEKTAASRLLLQLERKGVVTRVGNDHRISIHDLVREISYKTIVSPEVLHKKIARYYLRNGDSRSKLEALHHAAFGRDFPLVIQLITSSGNQFVGKGLSPIYLKILESIGGHAQSSDHMAHAIRLGRGQALESMDRVDSAIEILQGALEKEEEPGAGDDNTEEGRLLRAATYLSLGRAWMKKGEVEKCESAYLKGLAIASRPNFEDVSLKVMLLERVGNIHIWKGELDACAESEIECMKLCRQMGFFEDFLRAKSVRAWIYYWKGELNRAVSDLREALRECEKLGQTPLIAHSNIFLATTYSELGMIDEAIGCCQKSLSIYIEEESIAQAVFAISEQAIFEILAGRKEDAKRTLEDAKELGRSSDPGLAYFGSFELGLGLITVQDPSQRDMALKHFKRSEELYLTDKLYLARTLRYKGLAEISWGEVAQGVDDLNRAREIFKRSDVNRFVKAIESEIRKAKLTKRSVRKWASRS